MRQPAVLGRQHAALLLHRRHLAPDLVQVHRGEDAELVLQLAETAEQRGRAHVRRPGGQAGVHPAAGGAVPALVEPRDALEPAVAERAVDVERPRLADRRPRPVPGPLAQEQPQAGVGQRPGVAVDPGAFLERQRGAAADRLQRAEQHHHPLLVGAERGRGQRRQAAGERRRVRGREVLVDPAREHTGEVGVRVGQAGQHGAAATVDALGGGMARERLGRGTDLRDAALVHDQRGAVVDGAGVVGGDDRGVVDDGDGHAQARGGRIAATGVGSSSGSTGISMIAGLPPANAALTASPTWSGCST
jgi:hypothetical protein